MTTKAGSWIRRAAVPSASAACIVGTAFFGGACGSHFEGGLANAPSIGRRNLVRGPPNDVIANGRESCPAGDGGDPLPYRIAECEEEQADGGTPRVKKVAW
jgi:hypothetical protein